MDFEASFLGRPLLYIYEVVELAVDARLVMRTTDGPFPMETMYTLKATSGGTVMGLRNRGTPSGFASVAAPVMGGRHEVGDDQGPGAPGPAAGRVLTARLQRLFRFPSQARRWSASSSRERTVSSGVAT